MALLDRLSVDFDDTTLARGGNYFQRGAVDILRVTHRGVQAAVQGEHRYTVEIDWDGGFLDYSCSCPIFQQHGHACKHIWAVLLAADQRGRLPREADLDEMAGSTDQLAKADAVPGPTRPPVWKQRLAALKAQMSHRRPADFEPWPAEREMIYVVDCANTLNGAGIYIELMTRARRRDGQWERLRTLKRLSRNQVARLPDGQDRQILQMLAGAGIRSDDYIYVGFETSDLPRQFRLSDGAFDMILKLMCQTGRCRLRRDRHAEPSPLTWDDGEPWEFVIGFARDGGNVWKVRGILTRGEERIDVADTVMLAPGGLVFFDNRVAPLNDGGALDLAQFLRGDEKLAVRAGQERQLLAELFALPRLPRMELPEELGIRQSAPRPAIRLKIRPPGKHQYSHANHLRGELSFDYGGKIVAGDQPGAVIFDRQSIIQRDPAAEAAARARLKAMGFRIEAYWQSETTQHLIAPKALPMAVRTLVGEGWRIEAEGKLYRNAGAISIEVRSGIDWFELHASADFDGKPVALPRLLAALRKGETLVTLDDGTVGILPEEWLSKYGLMAAVAEEKSDHLRFGKSQAGLLDALLAVQPSVIADAEFTAARQALRSFEGIQAEEPPPGFVGELRPYQKEGLGWMSFLRQFGFGGCLADDMGLGKTVQVLALLESRRREGVPSLVVVPRSLIFNWKAEAARFAPALRILDHTGIGREKSADEFGHYDLIVTTYGTLRNDAPFLKDFNFDYIILDEAQAVKNASSESAKATRLLRGRHRLALSGTPVQNHLGELWSLFEFLNPGMLGASSAFAAAGPARGLDAESAKALSAALRPFILRRTKDQVARELPEKLEQTIYCDLDAPQRKLYDELRDHYRQSLFTKIESEGLGKSKMMVLEALLRLRQAACHPGLIDKTRIDEPSAKLDTLLSQLDEVHEEGHKALVFSQFTSLLAIVRKKLGELKIPHEYLDGKTRDRAERVERFQTDPECKLFLISLKAGGLGLNLTAAEYVFLLDPWWNPAVEAQAIDRAHRIGQTRRVFAYRLITRDTVEQKVLELQRTKRDLADAIITADNRTLASLKREDLELLLS
ncbi:MAG TPA: SNF2-related protein [Tepidisphaeraceae bacterium]|nr:SNF2-related protein [Tepidisphaeraceae bacterium]